MIETEVKYPAKTYRQKGAEKMVMEHLAAQKPPLDPAIDALSLEQFTHLLVQGKVCAWGACYR